MIGDTNLFFLHSEDCVKLAEAEIMIAEESARRKRRGWEAMLLMLRYGKCLNTQDSSWFCTFFEHLWINKMAQNKSQQHNNKTTLF
jgi:hypothetical protein